MADQKISQLPTVGTVETDDLVPIVDTSSSITRQATTEQILKDVLNPSLVVLAGDGVDVAYAAGGAGAYDTVTLSTDNQNISSFLTPTRMQIAPATIALNTVLPLSDLSGTIPANTSFAAELFILFKLESIQDTNNVFISGELPNIALNYVGNWQQVVCDTNRNDLSIKQNSEQQMDSAGMIANLGNGNANFGGTTSYISTTQNFLVENDTAQDQNLQLQVSSNYNKTTDNIIVEKGSYLKLIKVK